MLRVTSLCSTLGFQLPRIGWAPRPMKSPGGSTSQFAISTSLSSIMALPYFFFKSSLCSFLDAAVLFFSSLVIASFALFSASTRL